MSADRRSQNRGWELLASPARRLDIGFSLIEVVIALSVAGFCLLAILGLLQTGVTSQRATTEQTAATSIATMIFADLSAAGGETLSPRFQINLTTSATSPQTLFFNEAGKLTGPVGSAATADSRYRASLDVRAPASTSIKAVTGVRILVTWPAVSDPTPTTWPSKQAGAIDMWTGLDRN